MRKEGWVSAQDFLETLALAQVLPGPNICNMAIMLGDRFHGTRGALAALGESYRSASTATEIPISRTVTARKERSASPTEGQISFTTVYQAPPEKIDYLEGIATPMSILSFRGGAAGEVTLKSGFLKHSVLRDTAMVVLGVDIDTVPEEITRLVTTDVSPVSVVHGGKVSIKEVEVHRGAHKEPAPDPVDDGTPPNPKLGDPVPVEAPALKVNGKV